jgi:hypothetical protein
MAECGFCHRNGKDSNGKTHRGGMFISSDDQIRANEVANSSGGAPAVYKPTIGSCDPINFTLMAENCTARELSLGCEVVGAATSANQCGQCYGAAPKGSSNLLYVGPKPRAYIATLWVSHPGAHSNNGAGMSVTYSNGQVVTLPYSNKPLLDPQELTLEVKEGDSLVIAMVGAPKVWCAWLSSPDGNRTVSVDIGATAIAPTEGFTIAGDKRSNVVAAAMNSLADPTAWANFQAKVPNSVLWYQRRDEIVPGAVVSAWFGNTVQNSPNPQGIDLSDFVKMAAGANVDIPVTLQTFDGDTNPSVPKHLWINQDNGNTLIYAQGQTVDKERRSG